MPSHWHLQQWWKCPVVTALISDPRTGTGISPWGHVLHQGPAPACAQPCRAASGRGPSWMLRQQHAGGYLGSGRLPEPPAALPLSPKQRGSGAAPEPEAAAGGHIHCLALGLLTAQGGGRVLRDGGGRRRTGTRTDKPGASHSSFYSFWLHLPSPPLPAWQLGSTWTSASRKQMPFQPLMGGSEA